MSALKKIAPIVGTIGGGIAGNFIPGVGAKLGSSLGGALGGAIAGHAGSQQLQAGATSAGQQGANAATYRPVNSYNPYGSITNGPNGMNFQLSPDMAARQRMFGNLASGAGSLAGQAGQQIGSAGSMFSNLGQQYAQGANTAASPYLQAGGRAISALGSFNPTAYANDMYQKMASLSAPGNTDQTQNMLNYEQASGRGGLTQNGQLGDLGGLALAQKTADDNLRLQAITAGQNQQRLLGDQAGMFGNTGSQIAGTYGNLGTMFGNLGNTQANSAVGRYGDLTQTAGQDSGYSNQIGQQMLPYGQLANQQAGDAARAGGVAGGYLFDAQNNRNNINGSYQGGLLGQLGSPDMQSTMSNLGNKVGSWLSGQFGGEQPTGSTGTAAYTQNPTMPAFGFGNGGIGQSTNLGQFGSFGAQQQGHPVDWSSLGYPAGYQGPP